MATLVNRATGETFVLDPALARSARLRRRIFAWAKTMTEFTSGTKGCFALMVTLTYRHGRQWRPRHVRQFMLSTRKLLGEKLLGYAWVAELQKRGAVHYHVLLSVSRGAFLPMPDKNGDWPYGMTQVVKAKTLYYIAKYSQKGNDDDGNEYPKGCRIYATWVSAEVKKQAYYTDLRTSVFPKWLREIIDSCGNSETPRRERGGGWRIGDQVYKSPYYLLGGGRA